MSTPKEHKSYTFAVKVSTPMTTFIKELVFPIFEVPLEKSQLPHLTPDGGATPRNI